MAQFRMTIPTQLVLEFLLAEPEAERYGSEIIGATGLRGGTVHPILARLEGLGWVASRWEDIDPRAEGRPARRYYLLTAAGVARATHVLERSRSGVRVVPVLRPSASAGAQ